ncbi:autotransporter-associated beta strand repeat-containing protein [Sphingopyxis sp. CCNWLW253]|uniref:autotransporter-associated beta strand repeat-containing protein n=1 Tax=unclassified Sphingopyxis TaxID=2614943 RepID=UPI003012BEE3
MALVPAAIATPACGQEALYWDVNGTSIGEGGSATWTLSDPRWSLSTDGVSGPYRTWDNLALNDAFFRGTAGTVTLAQPIRVHNITFATNGYIITGNTLTLDGVDPTLSVTTGASTIASTITGTGRVIKAGGGTLTLSGNNSFNGGLTVSAGTLFLTGNNSFGSGPVITGGALSLTGTNSFVGDISVNGTLTASGAAALGTAGNNITISGGSLNIGATGGTLTGRTVTLSGVGRVNISGAGIGGAHFTGTGGLAVSAGVNLTDDSNNYSGSTAFNGAGGSTFSSIGNLGETSSLGAPNTVADGTIVISNPSGTTGTRSVSYVGDGDVSNRNWSLTANGYRGVGLTNSGTGTLTLTGAIGVNRTSLAQTPAFTAQTADLELLGVISGNDVAFNANAGLVLRLGDANTFASGSIGGAGKVEAATLTNVGVASSLGTGGGTGISGTLSYVGAGASTNRAWGLSGTLSNDGTGALTLSGGTSLSGTATLGGSFTGADNVISGVISGAGNLRGAGAGTWVVSGANSYTGQTIVDSGTLRAGAANAFTSSKIFQVNGGTLDLNDFNQTLTSLTGTGGTLDLGSALLTIEAPTGTTASFGGSIAGSGGLTKLGASTQTLTGASTYTGATTVGGGILNLDFSPAGGPASGIVGSGSTLNMAGGRLNIIGAAGESNSQTFNGLNITAGNNVIDAQSGTGGSLTVNLGAITRSGGLMNFNLPTGGNITTTNTSLGGWATVNGTDYAKVVGGNILAFVEADYTDKDNAADWLDNEFITDVTGFFGTVTGTKQLGGLRYTQPVSTTVTVSPGETLGVDGTIIVAPTVLATNQLITGGMMTGANGGVLGVQQNSSGNFTIASRIVDNGPGMGFTKAGTGLVTLSNTGNSYTGATRVVQGTLAVTSIGNGGAASSIGASSADPSNLVLEASTLRYTGAGDTSDRGFTFAKSGAITGSGVEVTNAGANLTFGGLVTSSDGANFTKTGAGTLTLANDTNDFTGIVTVSGGLLAADTLADGGLVSGTGRASSASANLVLAGGGLQYTGGTASTNRGFTLGVGNGTVDVANGATTLTVSGTAVGTGRLFKAGNGTLILSGTNSYTGGNTVNAGILRAGSTQAFGLASGSMTLANTAGVLLDLSGLNNAVGPLSGGGASGGNVTLGSATLTINGGGGNYSGVISGTGGVTRTGGGTQTFNGCNNIYTGPTSLQGAALSVDCLANGGVASGIGASGSASTNLVLNNGGLNYTGSTVTIDRGFQLAGGASTIGVISASTTLEFTGAIVGGGSLNKAGAGTLILSGTSSSTGNKQVSEGVLRAARTNAFGPQGVMTLNNTAGVLLDLDGYDTLVTSLNGGGAIGGNISLGDAVLTIINGGHTYAGAIGGNGSLIKNGTADQALSGCNSSYTGGTTVNGGTLVVTCLENGGVNSSIGASSSDAANLVINGSILRYIGTGDSTDRQFTLGAGGGALDASGSGTIAFTHAGPLTLAGSATARNLTLTGTNTGENIFSAELGDSGAGATGLAKTGTGTWRLNNQASNYTGATTISGGILIVDKLADGGMDSSIGSSSSAMGNLVIGNGSTFRYVGTGDITDRQFTLDTGVTYIQASGTGALVFDNVGPVGLTGTNATRTVVLGGTNTGLNTMGGAIGDNGTGATTLAKNDSGTWVLTGNNSFTGNTVINNGNLMIGNGGTTGNAGAGNVIVDSATSTLSLNRSDSFIFSGSLSGPGTLAQIGAGTSILTSASNSIGATTISAGTLQVDGALTTPTAAMTGTSALTVNGTVGAIAGGTVALNGDAGSSTITVAAAGTLRGSGDLGGGSDVVNLTGTLNTGVGALSLGDGDDILALNDSAILAGGVLGASGTDMLQVNNAAARTLAGTQAGGFETLAKSLGGTLLLTGTHDYANSVSIAGGLLQADGILTTSAIAMAGDSRLTVNGTVQAAGGAVATITGDAGANTVTVTPGSTLRAGGDLGGGTDFVILTGTLDTGAGTLSLGDGDDNFALNDAAVLTGGVVGGSGVDALRVNNAANRTLTTAQVSGFETLNKTLAGTLTLTGDHSYTNGVTIAAGTLQIGDGTATGTLVGNVANAGTLMFNRTGSSTYAGVISGGGAVNHNGNGTTIFTSNSNYSGTTSVAAGTLLINGDQSGATGLTSVASGATLGGTGTIGGNVTIADGGILAAGSNGAGTLTINGDLALGNTTQLDFEFGQANASGGPLNDLVDVGGNLTLDGTLIVAQSPGGTFGPGVYRMFNYGGTLTDNGVTVGSSEYLVQTSVANQVNLVNSAGLTLSFWDGDAGPHADGIIGGGSGTWRAAGDVNWTDSTGLFAAPFANASFAVFQGAGGTVAVDNTNGQVEATGMQFAVNGYTVQGGGLTLVDDSSQPGQSVIRVGDGTAAGADYTTTIASDLAGATQLVKTDAGTLILSGTNSYTGGTAINGGTIRISQNLNLGDNGGTLSFNGGTLNTAADMGIIRSIDLGGTGIIDVDAGTLLTINGTISGGGAFVKNGTGLMILTANNGYTGGTTVNAGILQVGSGTAGSIQGDVVNNAQIAFARSDDLVFGGAISGGGSLSQLGAGILTLTADNSYTGATSISNVNAGTLRLGSGGTTGSVAGDIANGGTLIFNRSNEYSFAGTISGTGDVRQEGTGTTILSADNSYTGSTVISSGTLLINGNQTAATGATNVLGGGTFGGTGTIGGDVFVGGGATLAPGDATGPGTLTINGNLGFSPNATLAYDFGQSNIVGGPLNDLTEVAGDLALDGTIDVTLSPGGSFDPGVYRVINYAGTLTDNGLDVDPAYYVQTSVANQVNLVNTSGLTMRFWDGVNGGKNDGAITGGDGLWQNSSGNDNWTEFDGSANAPFTDDAFAVFSGVGGTVTVDDSLGGITASGMQFASDGYSIIGTGVSLVTPQAVIRVGDGTANGAAYTATVASNLTGVGDLIKSDLGTLVLTGTNGFVGDVGVRGGELRLADGGTITSANGIVAIEAGDAAVMTVAGNDGSGNASTWTVGADLSVGYGGNGTLNVIDGGRVVSSAGQVGLDSDGIGQVLVSGTGSSWENSGRISVGLFGAGVLRIENGAAVTSNDGVVGGSGQGDAIISGPSTSWVNTQQLNVGSFGNGSLRIENGASVTSNQGYVGANSTGSAVVTGAGSNWLVTDFTMTIGNEGDGSLTIEDGGRVRAEGGFSLGVAAGVTSTVTLLGTTGSRGVLETSQIRAGAGTVNFTMDGGLLRATANNNVFLNNFATTDVTLGANGGVIDTDGYNIGISPRFIGAGGLVKDGSGTLRLGGANSYAGATLVNAGTLIVNGDQSAATGLTTVFSGATLGGNGVIGGNIDMLDGAILAPGESAGTLTVGGNLSLAGASILNYEFGQAGVAGGALNDLVNVGGDLVLDGTINVTIPAGGTFGPGIYRVFNYGGMLTDNGLAIGMMPAGSDVFVQTAVANQVNLINTGDALLNFWDGSAGASKFNDVVDGGSGMWRTALDNSWTEATGAVNAAYDNGAFAIFTGTGGVVTIDNSLGAVAASGLQFATTNYRIQGGALTLTGPQSVIRVGDGTSAGLGYNTIITSEITGSAQLIKTDLGRLELTGTNSYTGGTAFNGGTVQISSDANLGAASGGLSFNGGTLDTTADISSGRTVDLAGQGVFSTDADTTLRLTGNLTGAGLIGKLGAGTLVLAGTGNHTGGIGVAQGTLLVNGDYGAATGSVTVNQLTTLGGTGTIGGTVNLSGTLAPGAGGAGTLTVGGDLLISPTATLDFEFGEAGVVGGALNDLVNVGGNLVLDGVLNVGVPAGGASDLGIYRIFNYGGTLTDNGVMLGTMPTGSNAQVQTSIAGQVNLVNSGGLTLNFWDGAAGPKNDGVINGGSGVWQASSGNDNWTNADGSVNAPYSDGGFAVFGGVGGTVTVDDGRGAVIAVGMQFAANNYVIAGDGITLTDPTATIRVGEGSAAGAGFTATINSALGGAAQLAKTDAGTLILGGTNSYTGGTVITGGAIRIASDSNLGAVSGAVTLDSGTLETSATMASARDIIVAGDGAISTAADTVFTYNGIFSGAGSLTKAGTGTLLVAADNSSFGGSTSVAAGTLAVQGSLGGVVSVGAAGRVEGAGRVGRLVNAGVVAPGSGIGSLTVAGDYTGNGGVLEIEAALGGDASAADRLIVNGATSGNTRVTVINRGGLGDQTVEGIKIVDVAGASNGIFTLEGDYLFDGEQAVVLGAYGYRLYKNGVSTPQDGDWYLRSARLNGAGNPEGPLYQPGVPVYEAYVGALQSLNRLPTLQQRVGNRSWAASPIAGAGLWGRFESERQRPEALVSTSGADRKVDQWQAQLGLDAALSERRDGAALVGGLTAHYGKADSSVASVFGDGTIGTQGYGVGATMTWYGPQGFYVDGQVKLSWFDSDLESNILGSLARGNKGDGQAFSLELGKQTPIGGNLSITPQVQMSYAKVDFDRFADPSAAAVSVAKGESLKTRWGLAIDHQTSWKGRAGDTRRTRLYTVMNLGYEWLDGAVADVSGTPIANRDHRLTGELGLGGSYSWGDDRFTLYTEVSGDTAIADFGAGYNLKGTAGFRVRF